MIQRESDDHAAMEHVEEAIRPERSRMYKGAQRKGPFKTLATEVWLPDRQASWSSLRSRLLVPEDDRASLLANLL